MKLPAQLIAVRSEVAKYPFLFEIEENSDVWGLAVHDRRDCNLGCSISSLDSLAYLVQHGADKWLKSGFNGGSTSERGHRERVAAERIGQRQIIDRIAEHATPATLVALIRDLRAARDQDRPLQHLTGLLRTALTVNVGEAEAARMIDPPPPSDIKR